MDAIRKIEAALAAGPTEWDYDSNQTPFYNDADGYCRGGDGDGTYYLYGPDFFVDGERYEGPVLTKCCTEKDAKYISATGPAAIREVLQTLASKEAELAEAGLKYVSLFGELQNAMGEIARLKAAVTWIPMSSANRPYQGQRVIVLTTNADDDPHPVFANWNGEKYGFLGTGGHRVKPVTHWMAPAPIPTTTPQPTE